MAVGSNADIGALAGPETRTIDVGGAFISPGFNDGHYLVRNLGVPTISYGPGSMGQAHTPDEYIVVEDLIRGTQVLADVVMKLLT